MRHSIALRRAVASLSFLLVSCSGGGNGESQDKGAPATFTAYGEAQRISALWLFLRDTAAVLFPYVHDASRTAALGGTAAECLNGGTVMYTYTPDPNGTENMFQATFDQCAEPIGVIDGTVNVFWSDSRDDPARGRFNPAWYGQFSVGDVHYYVPRQGSVLTSYNPQTGQQQTYFTDGTGAYVTGTTGTGNYVSGFRATVSYTPGDGQAVISASLVRFSTNASNSFGELADGGSVFVDLAAASSAVLGLTTPITSDFHYVRGNRSNSLETIEGSATTSAGSLAVEAKGLSTKAVRTDEFAWGDIVASPDHDMDGE